MKLLIKFKSNKQTIIKNVKIGGIIIISIILLAVTYSLIFEQDKIKIDKYNFEQLEKAKIILEKIPKDAKYFYTFKKFNNSYKANIEPIKNCYYISNDNWKYLYIFWFKLESLLYKIRYLSWYYAYPRYGLSYDNFCYWWKTCIDWNLSDFKYTISNPCQD